MKAKIVSLSFILCWLIGSTLHANVSAPGSLKSAPSVQAILSDPQLSDRARCKALLAYSIAPKPKDAQFDPQKQTVVIVGGYSSGRFLPRRFRDAGIQVIHVHPHEKPKSSGEIKTFYSESYDLDFSYRGDLDYLIRQLQKFNILAAVPGSDDGTLLADEINDALARKGRPVRSNGILVARKDKGLLGALLEQLYLRTHNKQMDFAKQITTSEAEVAIGWIHARGFFKRNPGLAVIKPPQGTSGVDVEFVSNADEVRATFERLIGKRDAHGHPIDDLVVQEFLNPGNEDIHQILKTVEKLSGEYVVNMTSGKTTDMWKYVKRKGADGKTRVYGIDFLLPHDGPAQKLLIPYNHGIVHAQGINFGSNHNENMIVEGRGPVLIESNNRLMGSGLPILVELATGHSQIDRIVASTLDPNAFAQIEDHYTLQKQAIVVTLGLFDSSKKHKLSRQAASLVQAMPGYVHHSFNYAVGDEVTPTRHLRDAIGEVWLLGDDVDTLLRSAERLFEMEADLMFTEDSE